MAGKIATRNAYGEALKELAEKYPQLVVLDADLAHATMSKFFADAYPERFFNCGIAEANMTDIAAGMATAGFKPFTNTFAIFAAGRAYEQVRNSIAYPGLNVTVVGSHGGISVGEDGATHQCIEDFALMRAIPAMLVINPCDGHEMRLAVEALINYNGPAYLRLERPSTEIITDEIEGYHFELGKGVVLRDGSDVTIVATVCAHVFQNFLVAVFKCHNCEIPGAIHELLGISTFGDINCDGRLAPQCANAAPPYCHGIAVLFISCRQQQGVTKPIESIGGKVLLYGNCLEVVFGLRMHCHWGN